MKPLLAAALIAAALPAAAHAQRDVTRRAYTFLDDRLVVAVQAEAPGELQVVRGQRGRVEVAARSRDGFAGFGLGGNITRQLSLTALGSDEVNYLVVVPEHVSVRVTLPDGRSAGVPRSGGVASYRWGSLDTAVEDPAAAHEGAAILPTTAAGLYIIHTGSRRAPGLVDVPALASVRSIAVRVEGDDFRVAATRPLVIRPGHADHFEIRVQGEPLDLVIFVPRNTSRFELRSGSQRLAAVTSGRPRGFCGGTVIQQPTPHQDWLTIFTSEGRANCR